MIQGVDSKIVTQRTADYMRESNANVKNAEFAQTMMAKMEKQKKLKESQTVLDIEKGENPTVNKDGHNSNKGEQEENQGKKLRPAVTDKYMSESDVKYSGDENVGYEKNGSLDIEI